MVAVNDVACTATGCPQRGLKGAGNLVLRWTYGSDNIRFLQCRSCKAQFSERRGTPLFGLRLPKAKIVDVVKHLAEGSGIRATARLTGVSRVTVGSISKLVGEHGKAIHDELVRDLDVPEVQMDEMWSFVGKKRQASHRRGAGVRRAGKHVGPRRGRSRVEADGLRRAGAVSRPRDL